MATIKIKAFQQAVYDRTQSERSAWGRGVAKYALDLLEYLQECGVKEIDPHSPSFLKQCLNGASDWKQYSEGGNSLIYDWEIAERLCTPKEAAKLLKKLNRGGSVNQMEDTLLQTQARALNQAFRLVCEVATTHARKYDAPKAA